MDQRALASYQQGDGLIAELASVEVRFALREPNDEPGRLLPFLNRPQSEFGGDSLESLPQDRDGFGIEVSAFA